MSIPVFSHLSLLSVSRWRKLNCSSFPVRVVLTLLPIFSLHYPVCFWKLLFHPQLHVILPLFGTELRLFLLGFHFHFKALLQQWLLWEEGLLWFPCEPAHWFGQLNSQMAQCGVPSGSPAEQEQCMCSVHNCSWGCRKKQCLLFLSNLPSVSEF